MANIGDGRPTQAGGPVLEARSALLNRSNRHWALMLSLGWLGWIISFFSFGLIA